MAADSLLRRFVRASELRGHPIYVYDGDARQGEHPVPFYAFVAGSLAGFVPIYILLASFEAWKEAFATAATCAEVVVMLAASLRWLKLRVG